MESAKLNDDELRNLIFYGLKENGVDASDINSSKIESILVDYAAFCEQFQYHVIGELDIFERAACLLVAINRANLFSDKTLNASIAIDAAHKMCEKPYYYTGKGANIPVKLEEIDIKTIFENDMDTYNNVRNMRIQSLAYNEGSPLSYYLNLELFYRAAISLKHFHFPQTTSQSLDASVKEEPDKPSLDKKPKCKSIFARLFSKQGATKTTH